MAGSTAKEDGGDSQVFEAVHADLLRFFPELVTTLGGEPAALMRQAGIDPQCPGPDQPDATYRHMVFLLDLAAAQLDCPDFGMRLARRQGGASIFGLLGAAMRNSRTFGEALDYVSTHSYAHSLAARVWLRPSPAEGTVFSGHDILLGRLPNRAQAIEQIMLAGHLAAMDLTGGHARVRRVHFRHQPVSPLKTYRRYFGCEVRFGQNEDGVVYSDRDLACPVVGSDARMLAEITAFIDRQFTRHRPPLHADTRGVVMRLLGSGTCTNTRVARELTLHPRTLHRRLVAEGTSFQQIKDEVRRDTMLYYLQQTDLDFTKISEKLGFAEQSVMTRSCNRWFAMSPTKLRLQARQHGLTG